MCGLSLGFTASVDDPKPGHGTGVIVGLADLPTSSPPEFYGWRGSGDSPMLFFQRDVHEGCSLVAGRDDVQPQSSRILRCQRGLQTCERNRREFRVGNGTDRTSLEGGSKSRAIRDCVEAALEEHLALAEQNDGIKGKELTDLGSRSLGRWSENGRVPNKLERGIPGVCLCLRIPLIVISHSGRS